jgi:predicted amidohydrolase
MAIAVGAMELIGLRRRLVALADRSGDEDATLRLLVHAFAAANSLLEGCAALRCSVPVPTLPPNIRDALSHLDGSNPRVAYGQLLGVIAHLDAVVGPGLEGLTGGVIEVELGPVRASVHWWPRVDRAGGLRRLYDQRYKGTRYDYGPAAGLRHVALWSPTSRLTLEPSPQRDSRRHAWPLVGVPGNELRVILSPLAGEARPRFRVSGEPPAIGPDDPEMADLPALLSLLDQLLEDARAHRAHLLVLPEMMVPVAGREHLQRALRAGEYPLAVVAGSTYVADGGERRNESVWIDRSGRIFGAHQKRGYFAMRVKDLRTGCTGLPEGLDDDDRLSEDIVPGDVLRVVETAAGRIAMLICADLLDVHAPAFRHLVEGSAGIDLLLVISLSPTTAEFRQAAEILHRVGTSTLFVNASYAVRPGEDRAFVSTPFRREGPDRWSDSQCSAGFVLLNGERGVLVDLARWWD